MNNALLHAICSVPSRFNEETQMVRFLQGYAAAKGWQFQMDVNRNVRLTKRDPLCFAAIPAVVAHIDTVQPLRQVEIYENEGVVTGWHGIKQVGFGADNKTGIYVCLSIMDSVTNIAALFFAGEEIGMQGASKVDPGWLRDIGYVIEFDCPSTGIISYSCGGVELFENGATFIQSAFPVLERYGYNQWQQHPYTDVKMLRMRFPISCLNLASGYYNWHADNEFIVVSELETATRLGEDLVLALGTERYVFDHGKANKLEEALRPVTGLKITHPTGLLLPLRF
jgi:di/tripeptidase